MNARRAALLVIAGLIGCDVPMTAPDGSYSVELASNPAVTAGKALALSCLAAHEVAVTGDASGFALWIVPGSSMDADGHSSSGADLPYAGITDFKAHRIYVVQLYASDKKAWAHEFLHVLSGTRDHPDFFRACGLLRVKRRL